MKPLLILSFALISSLMKAQNPINMQDYPVPVGPITEMSYTSGTTYFSIWSPTAEAVLLTIYPTGEGGTPDECYDMIKSVAGKWTKSISGDLKGKFYTFKVKIDGRWLDETPGIFCKAAGVNGQRAAVIDMSSTNPDGWQDDKRPELKNFSDIVLYEMHHRDFSLDPESGIKNRGKFLALTEEGTKNASGLSTGIDHLKELGITHVHILPSYDFGSIDEKHSEHTYNWGYDPVNYNVPEGSYSTNPYDPATRIREFKQMVMALHKAGIRVVLDVVYNHVFDARTSQFDKTVPDYFFRHNADGTLANGSGCGNETASDMPMMRKFMIESVLYWANEYHIDGFRFDLMGIHDIETMNAIREAVNCIDPSIFIYGEGWAASAPILPESHLAMKANTAQMPGIAAFGDEMRDGLRGGWDDDEKGAFLIGEQGHEESIKYGIVGGISHPGVDMSKVNYSKTAWATDPTQMICYVSCHDDLCLADRIKITMEAKYKGMTFTKGSKNSKGKGINGRSIVDYPLSNIKCQKLAETAILTSQGVPFIWCGDEIMRDKKGVHNSYNSPDSVNTIPWANKTEYKDLFDYVAGLISLRKEHKAFHMGDADLVRKNLTFLPTAKNVIAYQINGSAVGDTWSTIIVILNGKSTNTKVRVPQGNYTIICRDGKLAPDGLAKTKGRNISVPAQSALIMYSR